MTWLNPLTVDLDCIWSRWGRMLSVCWQGCISTTTRMFVTTELSSRSASLTTSYVHFTQSWTDWAWAGCRHGIEVVKQLVVNMFLVCSLCCVSQISYCFRWQDRKEGFVCIPFIWNIKTHLVETNYWKFSKTIEVLWLIKIIICKNMYNLHMYTICMVVILINQFDPQRLCNSATKFGWKLFKLKLLHICYAVQYTYKMTSTRLDMIYSCSVDTFDASKLLKEFDYLQ